MVYEIYEDFFPEVEKKLLRISKKCAKYGNEFTYEIKGEEVRASLNERKEKVYHKFILVEVEGTAKINDWEFIATLEIHEVGNIIRKFNTEIETPERFWNSDNVCEHCNSNRYRTNLYIIHNVVTDEWKQVGKSCLKLYTGGLSMEYVAAYMDGITELEKASERTDYGTPCYSIDEVVGYAVEVIAKVGYFNSESPLPTKSLVAQLVCNRPRAIDIINEDMEKFTDCIHVFTNRDFNKTETKENVKLILDYYSNLDDTSDFIRNIKVMIANGYVKYKDFGYLSYLPMGYMKYLQKETERIEKEKQRSEELSEYFGEVGKRYKNKKIKSVVLVASWDSQYGNTYIYKIVTEDGYVLTWKTSNFLYLENNEKYDTITFTIKGHTEYRGQKQTEVTRCKIAIVKVEK